MAYASFTITQPFLGAPLQFSPALGSQELEQLIDAYVVGPAAKSDKLSEVTIEFYNHATVDLATGALVRRYDVFPSSPSSSFSPTAYTPSPSSCSATPGDSGYGSIIEMATPPTGSVKGARVSKKQPPLSKSKKETKKTAEIKLPGFTIMTKDGVDVTNSAAKGTKTREQREHAHLMRIMKACDACKKKKVRCDPSHRQGKHHAASVSGSATKKSKSASASSSWRAPSPKVSIPPLSQETTLDSSQDSIMPSFDSALDDFILFPADAMSWDAADMSFASDDISAADDLNQFNFDISDFPVSSVVDQPFEDFSFSQNQIQSPWYFEDVGHLDAPEYGLRAEAAKNHNPLQQPFSTVPGGDLSHFDLDINVDFRLPTLNDGGVDYQSLDNSLSRPTQHQHHSPDSFTNLQLVGGYDSRMMEGDVGVDGGMDGHDGLEQIAKDHRAIARSRESHAPQNSSPISLDITRFKTQQPSLTSSSSLLSSKSPAANTPAPSLSSLSPSSTSTSDSGLMALQSMSVRHRQSLSSGTLYDSALDSAIVARATRGAHAHGDWNQAYMNGWTVFRQAPLILP
ncbi:uncharacterized protein BP5553_01580 [Venustampulla echinocandica]|uniref:Zn(2)-C6 fungal-type domain-containing protein n=1 Tax=Venustampulla echinocandica TaxID=2656787 RepID=A0A370U1E9_9HELO|nr:uncharacterized protein BP5553_01580 [Venustampulla echinocandica]RDL41601.1 hypothetical protein BP5553_01580 [Venustampulla echinocandica]